MHHVKFFCWISSKEKEMSRTSSSCVHQLHTQLVGLPEAAQPLPALLPWNRDTHFQWEVYLRNSLSEFLEGIEITLSPCPEKSARCKVCDQCTETLTIFIQNCGIPVPVHGRNKEISPVLRIRSLITWSFCFDWSLCTRLRLFCPVGLHHVSEGSRYSQTFLLTPNSLNALILVCF